MRIDHRQVGGPGELARVEAESPRGDECPLNYRVAEGEGFDVPVVKRVADRESESRCEKRKQAQHVPPGHAALSPPLQYDESLVVPSSTGVIGERLPAGKIRKAIPKLVRGLGGDNAVEAAEAIMTTDAFPKYASRQLAVGEKTATVSAVAKGAGMICPDMATMLCFIMTDLDIQRKALSKALAAAARHSFNAITVDGDTSTNDSVFILANGVLVHITTEFGHLLRLNSDSNSERIRTPIPRNSDT